MGGWYAETWYSRADPADRYKGEAQLEYLRAKALSCRRAANEYRVTGRNSPADSGMWSDRQSRHRPHPSSTQEVGYIRPIVTVATATATGCIDILISSWPMSKRSSATDIASPPSVTTAVT